MSWFSHSIAIDLGYGFAREPFEGFNYLLWTLPLLLLVIDFQFFRQLFPTFQVLCLLPVYPHFLNKLLNRYVNLIFFKCFWLLVHLLWSLTLRNVRFSEFQLFNLIIIHIRVTRCLSDGIKSKTINRGLFCACAEHCISVIV